MTTYDMHVCIFEKSRCDMAFSWDHVHIVRQATIVQCLSIFRGEFRRMLIPLHWIQNKVDKHTWNTNMCLPAGTGPTRTESRIWSYSSLSAEPTYMIFHSRSENETMTVSSNNIYTHYIKITQHLRNWVILLESFIFLLLYAHEQGLIKLNMV